MRYAGLAITAQSRSRTVAEFVIGDVKAVRELTHERLVNAHLAEGWVLLLVREGSNVGHSRRFSR
jgi:hypothetical protein